MELPGETKPNHSSDSKPMEGTVGNKYLQIRDFARLTGIRAANLRFYDQIGLLSPEVRGENGYRYYSRRQLSSAYLIGNLRELDVGLEEIKQYAGIRTPERMLTLFEAQEKRITAEMDRLFMIREMMKVYAEMAQQALQHGENDLLLEDKEAEPIYIGPKLSPELSEDEAVLLTYDDADEHGVNLGYPFGGIVDQELFERGTGLTASRYYFKTERNHNAWKPKGRYAVAYGRCAMGYSDPVYDRLASYLKEQGLHACSDAYEEYPLNELSMLEEEQYCVKVEIRVE